MFNQWFLGINSVRDKKVSDADVSGFITVRRPSIILKLNGSHIVLVDDVIIDLVSLSFQKVSIP